MNPTKGDRERIGKPEYKTDSEGRRVPEATDEFLKPLKSSQSARERTEELMNEHKNTTSKIREALEEGVDSNNADNSIRDMTEGREGSARDNNRQLSYEKEAEFYRKVLENEDQEDMFYQEALEAAGLFAVMTATQEPDTYSLTHAEKVRAHNGERVEGVSQETIRSELEEDQRKPVKGIRMGYVAERLKEAARVYEEPLGVTKTLNHLEAMVEGHNPDGRAETYRRCIEETREEFSN